MDAATKNNFYNKEINTKFMKKKIFGAVIIIAIVVGAMINVNLNKVSNKGDLAMANVEALAQETDMYFINTTNYWGNNTVSTCTCSTCQKGEQNVVTQPQSPVVINNSGVTGVNGQYGGTGVGGSYSQGQTVIITTLVNCLPMPGCCDTSKNGTFTQKVTA